MEEIFNNEELADMKSHEWWQVEFTQKVSPRTASLIYSYISYLEGVMDGFSSVTLDDIFGNEGETE